MTSLTQVQIAEIAAKLRSELVDECIQSEPDADVILELFDQLARPLIATLAERDAEIAKLKGQSDWKPNTEIEPKDTRFLVWQEEYSRWTIAYNASGQCRSFIGKPWDGKHFAPLPYFPPCGVTS